MATTRLDRLMRWASENPLSTGAAVVGAGVVCYAAYKIIFPDSLFKKEDAEVAVVKVRFASDGDYPAQVGGLVRAIRELGAEGVFREQEARAITREFVDLARTGATVDKQGDPVLSRDACRALFSKIGIQNTRVADNMFDSFDEDGSGSISLKEFLHALVLVMRGSTTEKLDRMFDCIDLDHDGFVSEPEMAEFYRTLYAFSGTHRTRAAVAAQVKAMFLSMRSAMPGLLTREEFRYLASEAKFHVGDSLVEFYDQMMKRFALSMESVADSSVA